MNIYEYGKGPVNPIWKGARLYQVGDLMITRDCAVGANVRPEYMVLVGSGGFAVAYLDEAEMLALFEAFMLVREEIKNENNRA